MSNIQISMNLFDVTYIYVNQKFYFTNYIHWSIILICQFNIFRHVSSDPGKSKRPRDRAIILINLCVALILSYILFLAGVTQTDNKVTMINVIRLILFSFDNLRNNSWKPWFVGDFNTGNIICVKILSDRKA